MIIIIRDKRYSLSKKEDRDKKEEGDIRRRKNSLVDKSFTRRI